MDANTICLVAGPLISFLVSALKAIPWVKNNPKWVAFAISAILGSVTSLTGMYHGISIAELAQCVLIQFAGAVTTHEAVVNPIKEKMSDNAATENSKLNDTDIHQV